ncbi:MAG: hypothetical protein NTV70_17045 [Acidobacteria bacterium]|nr:hypothetical protein [Acidobacteriota bacterium]
MAEKQIIPDINPFLSLNYEYGMLLGREDFVTEQGYHRGKTWLHNAWLHREGVVWGLGVTVAVDRDEIVVSPGLALAPAGQELYVGHDVCVNVPAWLEKHRGEASLVITADPAEPGTEIFDAHITLAPAACLSRAVPSIAETCGDAGSAAGVAYSRVSETVEIRLVPGRAPKPLAPPYQRLRRLFSLEPPAMTGDGGPLTPADQAVMAARNAILALPAAQRPAAWLKAFQEFAALDAIDLRPWSDPATGESSLRPSPELQPIVLAELLGLRVARPSSGANLTKGSVDYKLRPTHVATRTIEELLNGPATATAPAAAGPQVVDASVTIADDSTLVLQFTTDIQDKTLSLDSIALTVLNGPWVANLKAVAYDAAARQAKITTNTPLAAKAIVRLIVRGTGPAPVMGVNGFPLAGAQSAPRGTAHDGSDFVFIIRRGA